MNLLVSPRHTSQTGYTLLTTLILTGCITAMLAATLSRNMTNEKLNDRNNSWQSANAAAEAATEKVLSRMMVDFANGGEVTLSNNLTTYRTGMLPNTNENSYWTNFVFSDGNGNNNATYVARTTTSPNPPYVTLEQQYPGLSAFASTYRILSNAQYTDGGDSITGVVQQDVQMAEIPVFQFAIFYNGLLEFSDCAPLVVNGRVNCNSNIYVGCQSSSSLSFNYFVTCAGTITNPAWDGYLQSSWGGTIHYGGSPSPGYGTGEPVLTLPIGTNSSTASSVIQIINPPTNGESTTNPLYSLQFYNEASMVIIITNASVPTNLSSTNLVVSSNVTNVLNTNSVTILVKNGMYDTSPYTFAVTNGNTLTNVNITNVANYSQAWINWCNLGITNWLSTTNTFYDQRENRYLHITQIDVGQLANWISTTTNGCNNPNLDTKWSSTTPFNGIVYVIDSRATNTGTGGWMDCVRLVHGSNLTNGLYSGFTLATQNPLYIQGVYNCPNPARLGTNDDSTSRPSSVISDALTILSPAWSDAANASSSSGIPNATNDTVNTAIITGNVPSTGSAASQFSGGVHNLPRLLENWETGGYTLTLNTSMICLYASAQATQQFVNPPPASGAYYEPPNRNFLFDQNFTNSYGLPPGTPQINRLIRADWGIAPPNTVTYNSPTLDFVPH